MSRTLLQAPQEFEALARSGLRIRPLARRLGVSQTTVRKWCETFGIVVQTGSTSPYTGEQYIEIVALNDGLPLQDKQCKYYRYRQQKKAAAKRGIGWEISFPEWVAVWNESGKWSLRGNTRGRYCMARTGDEGPYKVGNVRIALFEENARESAEVLRSKRLFRGCRHTEPQLSA